MTDSSKEHDPRHIVRHYTTRLKAILLGEAAATAGGSGLSSEPGSLEPASVSTSSPPPRPPHPPPPAVSSAPPASEAESRPPLPLSGGKFNPLRAVEEHLQHPRGRFAELLSQIQRLHQLNQLLHAFLPPHLQDHATLARLDADAWVVQTDSPVWQTRLYYLLPALRQPLSEKLGFAVPPPQIRIVPPEAPPKAPPVRRMTMTEKTVQELEQAAREFSDPRLRAAVQRLAEHGRQRNRQP
jgi:hypothetical protein